MICHMHFEINFQFTGAWKIQIQINEVPPSTHVILSNCLFSITVFYVGDLFNKVAHYNNYITPFQQNWHSSSPAHQTMILCFMIICCYKHFPIIINLLIFSKWEKKNRDSQTFFPVRNRNILLTIPSQKVSWILIFVVFFLK